MPGQLFPAMILSVFLLPSNVKEYSHLDNSSFLSYKNLHTLTAEQTLPDHVVMACGPLTAHHFTFPCTRQEQQEQHVTSPTSQKNSPSSPK